MCFGCKCIWSLEKSLENLKEHQTLEGHFGWDGRHLRLDRLKEIPPKIQELQEDITVTLPLVLVLSGSVGTVGGLGLVATAHEDLVYPKNDRTFFRCSISLNLASSDVQMT